MPTANEPAIRARGTVRISLPAKVAYNPDALKKSWWRLPRDWDVSGVSRALIVCSSRRQVRLASGKSSVLANVTKMMLCRCSKEDVTVSVRGTANLWNNS